MDIFSRVPCLKPLFTIGGKKEEKTTCLRRVGLLTGRGKQAGRLRRQVSIFIFTH